MIRKRLIYIFIYSWTVKMNWLIKIAKHSISVKM